MFRRRLYFSFVYFVVMVYGVYVYESPIYFIFLPLIPFSLYASTMLKINIPIFYEYIFLLFILLSTGFGSMLDFYVIIPYWDIILHTLSGFILAMIPLYFLVHYKIELPMYTKIILIFLVSMGFASLWEMFEFGIDNLLNIDSQKNELEGVIDTMIDICCHSLGSIILLIIYFVDNKLSNKMYNTFCKYVVLNNNVK